MATTRKKIREQIQLKYSQYLDKNGFNDNIDVRVIDLDVEQSINKLLKVQTLQNFKSGNIEIPTCNMIEYTLTPSSNAITLPVFPLQLPLDMGIWKISLADGVGFIPINSTMSNVYGGTNAAYLENQTGYTVSGLNVRFTKTVTATVTATLLVADFETTGLDDILPLSPEIESDVIMDVLDKISNGRVSQPELNVKKNEN